MESNIKQVGAFVEKSFQENPAYSFGDWTIMYQHSLKVKELADKIAVSIPCDKELLALEALLHDIGKAYQADAETLRKRHAELGYEVAKDFLPELGLGEEQSGKLREFLLGDMSSVEARIVQDADTIAFFADERLQKAFKIWADKEGLADELQRKADKINQLKFAVSKKLAKSLHEEMKKHWHLRPE